MQAIRTKYLPPTNVRGSRVKAMAHAGSITIGWDCSLNTDDNHWAAAEALIKKMKWDHVRIQGYGHLHDHTLCFVLCANIHK